MPTIKRRDLKPENDGVNHINVYSQGKTELGRLLSNFAHTPIMTEDGSFLSLEGYWYWLSTSHPSKEKLRNVFGHEAKELGDFLSKGYQTRHPRFKEKILADLRVKITTNERLKELLLENKLPLAHYYAYGNQIVFTSGFNWFLEEIEAIQVELLKKQKKAK